MSYESIRAKGAEVNLQEIRPRSLRKGVIVNALSPYPYLFWLSVGAPTMTKAINQNVIAPFVFIVSFYAFLVGSKIVLSILVGKSKSFLSGKLYSYLLRFLGVVLFGFAMALFRDGLKLLNIL
jgi:threonine/homoserine/homoserine lactone efflux protein